ncbi:MAG: UvrB/UvrC motif-containing protein [bacterium]|nr:MAG: UvrB/UvrC motif-containing protein [bacterium]
MICDICGIREATIKFTQVINKKKTEMHTCKVCAEEKGFTNPLSGFPKIIGGLILGIMGELPETVKREHIDLKCDYCQLSWHQFQDKGLLGCGHCYESFVEPMKKLLRKMHGSNKHIGNRPTAHRVTGTIDDLDLLRKELKRAIKAENYEHAAELRDKIRDIEASFK